MADGPTIYDIAAKAQVGIATVSRVLNGRGSVASATRDAIMQAVNELGYRPNRSARSLASGVIHRPRIAALVPLFRAAFSVEVTRALAGGLETAGMDLLLFDVPDRAAKQRVLDRLVAARSCEGIVLCSMGVGSERQLELKRLGIPFVFCDFSIPGVPSVAVDNVAGGELLAQTLLARGAQHPALVSGPDEVYAFLDREQGFRQAAPNKAPVLRATAITREAGRALVPTLLKKRPAVDAVACVNDQIALGVVEGLRATNVRVPEDVQVIGFDDMPLMDVLGLSTIRQDLPAFGAWAAEAIAALVRDPSAELTAQTLPLAAVLRQTTR